ncbi:MAG: DUF2252 family protein [Myxococcota bacterium]
MAIEISKQRHPGHITERGATHAVVDANNAERSRALPSSDVPAGHRTVRHLPARRAGESLDVYTRRYYRELLLEAAKADPAVALCKGEKMSADAHACFRGSLGVLRELILDRYPRIAPPVAKNAALAARDIERSQRMTVLGNNDLHVYNYGVTLGLVDGKRRPVFGATDVDETAPVPFACDLVHDGVSRVLEARVLGLNEKKAVEALVEGYEHTLVRIAKDPARAAVPLTKNNAPEGPVRELLAKAEKADQPRWLARQIHADTGLFRTSLFDDAHVHCPEQRKAVQQSLELWLQGLPQGAARPLAVEVADTIYRRFAGTASVDRLRLQASVRLTLADGIQSRHILEIKEERPATYRPTETLQECARRAAVNARLLQPGGDPLLGDTLLGRVPTLVRERNAYEVDIDRDDLDKRSRFRDYAQVCGTSLALQHAAQHPGPTARRLLDSIEREDLGGRLEDFVSESTRELGDYFEQRAYPLFCEVFAELRGELERKSKTAATIV